MQFPPWQTLIDEASRCHDKQWRRQPLHQQYADEFKTICTYPFRDETTRLNRIIRMAIETQWHRDGRPYYNIHPQMAKKLVKTNLDRIPARYIEIPNEFKCVHVRFAENIPLRMMANVGFNVALSPEIQNSLLGCRSVLFGRFSFDDEPMAKELLPQIIGEEQFVMIVDEGARTEVPGNDGKPVQRMLCNLFHFGIRPEETIPAAIDRTIEESKDAVRILSLLHMRERLTNLFRVLITTGFLANCPEDMVVLPEILSKDTSKYEEAVAKQDRDAMDRIVARSQRRGKKGWNVGTDEMFLPHSPAPKSSSSTPTGKELQWSHLRSGHPHAVRYGHKKSKVKIKWFRGTRVREDLPFKPEEEE
jgi:hypothetical protein